MAPSNFDARDTLAVPGGTAYYYRLAKLEEDGLLPSLDRLPFSIRVMLEGALRGCDSRTIREEDVRNLAAYEPTRPAQVEVPFAPGRVLLQDFTGVPAVVDLAALRSAMGRNGGDPAEINPRVKVDLVIDHSVQVDAFAVPEAFRLNGDMEFERNRERYEFLRWGSEAFENFSVVPPERGICHQVNLEYLARVVLSTPCDDGLPLLYPDTLVGTDSHTTMVNGLGVVGWGVGGIEAEAAMLGQPSYFLMPEVVGFRLTGALKEGVTATDLTLTVTQMLRKKGVVGKFVEFFGTGLSSMSLADRATIANMAPEYGATMGFFPVDHVTLDYLRRTNRPADLIETVERYARAQKLFRTDETPDPEFVDVLDLDLGDVEPSMAGPKRPQDRLTLPVVAREFREALTRPASPQGFGLTDAQCERTAPYTSEAGEAMGLRHGDVVIAAITSCTNTSNPSVMLAAGLLAKKAVERGLTVRPYVKTSLAPGSRVVTEYLDAAGLTPYLDRLGFSLVGYGCTTCIGNSGPLPDAVRESVTAGDLVVAGVLSGNRNFEGRIHPLVKANYLASPPLVVAYALAGTVARDLTTEPLGQDADGADVYLKDLWPSQAEIAQAEASYLTPAMFAEQYEGIETSNPRWNALPVAGGAQYDWKGASTYVREPPFFMDVTPEVPAIAPVHGARVLVKVGDSVTTDHISPAGAIPKAEPAGQYLIAHGVEPKDFNSFGARRGNHEVMMRGTFANIRLRNEIAPGTEGGWSTHLPTGEQGYLYDVAMRYEEDGTPLLVVAGHDYGMGSSRDWAAKGTALLGVRAVLAQSYERIHRSNLVGMGVLPLLFRQGESLATFGLDGTETYDVPVVEGVKPGQMLTLTATKADGTAVEVPVQAAINTPIEVEYYRHGGILNYVLREFLSTANAEA
jgi:aconitate hydratase